MTRSLLLTCDKEQIDGGRVVGTCAARIAVTLGPDGSSENPQSLGWLDTGTRQLCPRHNPYPSLGRVDPFPRLRDQAPRPAADRPIRSEDGRVTPLRPIPETKDP